MKDDKYPTPHDKAMYTVKMLKIRAARKAEREFQAYLKSQEDEIAGYVAEKRRRF